MNEELKRIITARHKNYIYLVPSFSLIAFCFIYYFFTGFYPGGSSYNLQADGFSWVHNNLSDLLEPIAINGVKNPVYIWINALTILISFSIGVTFLFINELFTKDYKYSDAIRVCGFVGIEIYFIPHVFFNVIGVLMLTYAVFGALYGFFLNRKYYLFGFGCFVSFFFSLISIFNFIGVFVIAFPLLQKLTLACFFIWIILINWEVVNETASFDTNELYEYSLEQEKRKD